MVYTLARIWGLSRKYRKKNSGEELQALWAKGLLLAASNVQPVGQVILSKK